MFVALPLCFLSSASMLVLISIVLVATPMEVTGPCTSFGDGGGMGIPNVSMTSPSSSRSRRCDVRRVCCFSIRLRPATDSDVSRARRILLSQFMNPLSVSRETLVVAYDGDDDGEDDMLGFGQIRPLGDVSGGSSSTAKHRYHELASLYVPPAHRKRGVGTAIATELLRRFDAGERDGQGGDGDDVVCLLTLRPTVPFYQTFGFRSLDVGKGGDDYEEIPPPLRFEYAAGTALSSVLGNDLVCMVRD